ncbi:hypothetical protein SRHO_G00011270 [Serrasalmus rhombeus]
MDNQTELLKGIEKRIEANTVAIDVNKKATSELQSTINHQQKGNLRVTGLPEKDDENMRETIIGILTKVIPVSVDRLRETVDTVHRLGQRASAATSNNLPRAVIIQFGMRTVRDEVWKKSKEDFSKEDRLARTKLWPLVQEARSRGKRAYLKEGYALIENKRVDPTNSLSLFSLYSSLYVAHLTHFIMSLLKMYGSCSCVEREREKHRSVPQCNYGGRLQEEAVEKMI